MVTPVVSIHIRPKPAERLEFERLVLTDADAITINVNETQDNGLTVFLHHGEDTVEDERFVHALDTLHDVLLRIRRDALVRMSRRVAEANQPVRVD